MILKHFLNFLYPPMCRGCGVLIPNEAVFCATCVSAIKPIVSYIMPLTRERQMTVFAISAYQDPIKHIMLKKFSRDIVAIKQLGSLMVSMTNIQSASIDYIVPIPLHWTRYARRGFNQAHEMACVIGKELKKPVVQFLKRSKRTVFQSRLTSEQRQENVKDAFVAAWWYRKQQKELLHDKHILLVDDLCTTGATLKYAAKTLLAYKPKSITAVVACRAVQ